MKNRKFLPILLTVALTLVLALGVLAACDPNKDAVNTYNVELVYNAEQGSVSLSPQSADGSYEEGSKLTLTVQPAKAYNVDSVKLNSAAVSLDGEGKYEFVVEADTSIEVTFKNKNVDPGIFGIKWASENGVLDLKAGTYSGAESFEILEVAGEGEETEISVACDSVDYTLKLTEDGKLGMYKNSEEATETFQVVPEALAGAWSVDSDFVYMYYVIDPSLSEDGYFKCGNYSFGEEIDTYDGNSMFSIEDGKPVITFDVEYYGYPYYSFIFKDSAIQLIDYSFDFEGETHDLVPYAFEFSGNYLYEGGTVEMSGEELTFNGAKADYELKATDKGAGYAFTVGGEEYLLQNHTDGNYVVGNTSNILVAYSPNAIMQTWYSSDGKTTFAMQDGEVTVATDSRSETAAYKIELVDGVIECSFDCSLGHVTLSVIGNVETAMQFSLDDSMEEEYVIVDFAREYFFKTMTDNYEEISIDEDQIMTTKSYSESDDDESFSQEVTFTYVPELEVVALQFVLYEGIYYGETAYLVSVNDSTYMSMVDDGVAISTYSVYFTTDSIGEITAMFEGNYTTGGSDPQTLSFDFSEAVKKVIYQGEEYEFFWNCEINDLGVMPKMDFIDNERNYCSLEVDGKGLYLIKAGNTGTEDHIYFVTEEAYDKIKGTSFTYKGEYYEETFRMTEDGEFWISSSDTSNSDTAVKDVKYNYFLQNYIDLEGRDTYVIAFNSSGNFYVMAYIYDFEYGMVMDMRYSKSDISEYVGTYFTNDSVFVLERDGSVTLDGENAKAEFVGEQATFTLNGKEYSAKFESGKVTLTEGGKDTEYTYIDFNELAFVGTYTLGENTENEKTIVVTASAVSPNLPPTLNVTLDGMPILNAVLSVVNGKQTLSFSVIGFPDPTPINYTLTLDGGKITVSDGTLNSTVDSNGMSDYSIFSFDDPVTLTDESVIVCLKKTGGKTPYFYVQGGVGEEIMLSSSYSLSYADGVATLEVFLGADKTLQLIYDPNEEGDKLKVQWKGSDIPEPPGPPVPPPPAPPLP